MLKAEHLENAPIVEAIIDIQIEPVDIESLPEVKMKRATKVSDLRSIEIGFQFPADATESHQQHQRQARLGRRYDLSGGYVLQHRVNGFTLSKLRPYEDWETFRTEAQTLWSAYRKLTKDARVTRVAVRYVNRLNLPIPTHGPGLDLEYYLKNCPPTPDDDLFKLVRHFLCRMVLPLPEDRMVVILNTNLQDPTNDESGAHYLPVILDIDVFREVAEPIDGDEVWYIVDRMRDIKNHIFFSVMTKEALELWR